MQDEGNEPNLQEMEAREHAKGKGKRKVGSPEGTTERERKSVRERLGKEERERLAVEALERERVRHEQVERECEQASHIHPMGAGMNKGNDCLLYTLTLPTILLV